MSYKAHLYRLPQNKEWLTQKNPGPSGTQDQDPLQQYIALCLTPPLTSGMAQFHSKLGVWGRAGGSKGYSLPLVTTAMHPPKSLDHHGEGHTTPVRWHSCRTAFHSLGATTDKVRSQLAICHILKHISRLPTQVWLPGQDFMEWGDLSEIFPNHLEFWRSGPLP